MRAKLLNRSFSVLFRSQFVYLLENLKNIKKPRYRKCQTETKRFELPHYS
jgi:hypothetical protein